MQPIDQISKIADREIFGTPEISPHFKTWKHQWIGMLFLILIPTLALMGLFGEKIGELEQSNNDISLSMEYPERMRLGQTEYIRLEIKNKKARALEGIRIKLNHNYLKRFHDIETIPSFNDKFEVSIKKILPHDQQIIYLKLKAQEHGFHSGKLSISDDKTTLLKTQFKTLILP